jgi:hypothetical protein
MPAGNICCANIGTPLPLSYGFFRATGMQLIDFTVLPTLDVPLGTFPAGLQIGFWDLGEGELDGCNSLWIDNILQFSYDLNGDVMGSSLVGHIPSDTATTPTLNAFSFHTGCDAPVGSSPGYSATQQWLDPMWAYLGGFATSLCYSRRAYYVIGWTPPTTGGGTLAPLADFRGMRCRLFDGSGTQTAYRFTTNPIWHFVDLWLRRAIKPEYAIDPLAGPDALTSYESSCFNWPSIYAAAQYCDYVLANGNPRFSGSYVFASGSTLQAMLEQVLLCCRGYMYEYNGQIYVFCDQPRDSTFLMSGKMLVPGSFMPDQTEVNQAGNRFIATYLEVGLPAVAQISTIARTSTEVDIITVGPNPCAPGDIINIGGVEDPTLDASYTVDSVPGFEELTCALEDGVSSSSTGGYIGYIQSRFSQRTPEISHQQHQQAQGQILPPAVTGTRLKRKKVNYNLATMTYDQAMRILQYETYRGLGIDWLNPALLTQIYGNTDLLGSPYQPPFGLTLSAFSESVDVNGNALKAQFVGDIITLDPSVFFEFAGDWEIIDRYTNPMQQEIEDSTDGNFLSPTSRSGAMTQGTDQNSGILKFVLRSFNRSVGIFTDVSNAANASFQTVPGNLPYAGAGSAYGLIPGGTCTVATEYTGLGGGTVVITWTSFEMGIGYGDILTYTSGGTSNALSADGPWYLYVYDPTSAGGGGKVFLMTGGSPPNCGPGQPPDSGGIQILTPGGFTPLPQPGAPLDPPNSFTFTFA